jgi:hypothetical protein
VELAVQIESMPLEILFDCLGSDNRGQIETACGILKNLMLVSDSGTVLQKYHESMLQGFLHPFPEVRSLVIAQV